MATDLSALIPVQTAAGALSGLVLATPQVAGGYQPQNGPSAQPSSNQPPPTILFHYEGEQSVALESDITDHYVENNSTIQDQIALRPETITTHGFIGELNDVVPPLLAPIKTIADKLTVLEAYTPELASAALLAYAQATQAYDIAAQVANAGVAAFSSFSGSGSQTKQQTYFALFYGYWQNRTLFTVQTPWALFTDCAIKSLRAIQDAETNVITDFEVTFKKMRFASVLSSPILGAPVNSSSVQQGRAANQSASLVDLGTSTPPAAGITLASLVA